MLLTLALTRDCASRIAMAILVQAALALLVFISNTANCKPSWTPSRFIANIVSGPGAVVAITGIPVASTTSKKQDLAAWYSASLSSMLRSRNAPKAKAAVKLDFKPGDIDRRVGCSSALGSPQIVSWQLIYSIYCEPSCLMLGKRYDVARDPLLNDGRDRP